jgi:pimeloyl-ACP methyl ester carboxylesterase
MGRALNTTRPQQIPPVHMLPTETLTVAGTEVRVDGAGDETLVMIHGWPDTQALWDRQVAHFRAQIRCVRFTLPGYDLRHGRRAMSLQQTTAHIAAIVDAVSPNKPVTLLLHDWGAVYGYQYLMENPLRVARVVGVDIGDTASGEFLRSLSIKGKLMIAAYQLWLAVAYLVPPALGNPMTRWMARQLGAPAPAQAIAAQMNYPYVAQWSGGLRAAKRVDAPCPMLFIYGEQKPFMFHSPRWAARLAAQSGSAVHGLNAGHWVMVNEPTAFNHLVSQWLGLPSAA